MSEANEPPASVGRVLRFLKEYGFLLPIAVSILTAVIQASLVVQFIRTFIAGAVILVSISVWSIIFTLTIFVLVQPVAELSKTHSTASMSSTLEGLRSGLMVEMATAARLSPSRKDPTKFEMTQEAYDAVTERVDAVDALGKVLKLEGCARESIQRCGVVLAVWPVLMILVAYFSDLIPWEANLSGYTDEMCGSA